MAMKAEFVDDQTGEKIEVGRLQRTAVAVENRMDLHLVLSPVDPVSCHSSDQTISAARLRQFR
ncbi:MAG: hypothetical protein EOP89_13715 [Lysobacteraceae bacterium]|nr:MAG: hypothetical protein EOP89_13715 [Xanthomonadaceae bacterium]